MGKGSAWSSFSNRRRVPGPWAFPSRPRKLPTTAPRTTVSKTSSSITRWSSCSSARTPPSGVRPLSSRRTSSRRSASSLSSAAPSSRRDDAPDSDAVLVLSYKYWKERHGADPEIVGRVFQMNNRPHTVVGVLPPIPQYPVENDVYMPTSACPFRSRQQLIDNRQGRMVTALGRIRPEVALPKSQADLDVGSGPAREDVSGRLSRERLRHHGNAAERGPDP